MPQDHNPGWAAAPTEGLPNSFGLNPNQDLPALVITDNLFLPQDWDVAAQVIGNASYTVTQQLAGGVGNTPFRFMSHRLGPVPDNGRNTIFVTHLYLRASYNPLVSGAIRAIDYSEAGIILSFPFPEAFSTTQPIVVQDGRIYRSPKFIRFVAADSSLDFVHLSFSGYT